MDLTYVGKSEGDYFELFHFLADGNRPVLEVLVDINDAIWVAPCAAVADPMQMVPQETKGKAHRHAIADGLEEVICLTSVATYVVPRIATLMARAYCPVVPVQVAQASEDTNE